MHVAIPDLRQIKNPLIEPIKDIAGITDCLEVRGNFTATYLIGMYLYTGMTVFPQRNLDHLFVVYAENFQP